MKRKNYLLFAGCLLLVLIASSSLADPCQDAFTNLQNQCTSTPPHVFDYIHNYITQLYPGPYYMWWSYTTVGGLNSRLENPAIDWAVAPVKYYDQLPGSELPQGVIFERNVPVQMSDGLKLACNVFRPDKPGKFPVIMNFTPFSKDGFLQHDPYGASQVTAFESPDPGWWVSNDYVVVLCDNRNSGRSPKGGTGGNYDFYDGIEWAGTQPWSNGKVGMLGHSIFAVNQYNAAGMVDINGNPNPPPHLTAIIPWGGFSDMARDVKFPGGVPETHFRTSSGPNIPLWQIGESFPARPPLPASKLANIKIPTLIGATWTDKQLHLRGDLRAWRTISTPLKYKWLYTYSERKWQGLYTPEEARNTQRMFFDHFLKGKDSGIMQVPHVRLARQVKILDWSVRYDNDWPIPGTQYTKLYLGTNSTLNFDKQRAGEVIYDSATGKATFSITFDRDTEISGHIMLKLWVSPLDTNDMDIFVMLRKFDASGHELNFDSDVQPGRLPVDYGWLRLSKRALDPTLSKPYLPEQISVTPGPPEEKVTPGQIVPCEIQVVGSSTLFHAGETLRVDIAGGMPADWLFAYESTVNVGQDAIYFGGNYDSYLMVPVIPHEKAMKHLGYGKYYD